MFRWLFELIKRLFGNKGGGNELPPPEEKRIICPHCLANIPHKPNLKVCSNPECDYVFPIEYLRHFETTAPMFLQVFGWTQHGKTMFLDVLRLILMDSMEDFWHRYDFAAVTDLDQQHQNVLRMDRQNGRPPGTTPKRERSDNEVYVNKLQNMERWGNRFLVIMDHAGEQFESVENIPADEIPYLIKTQTTFMIISLSDIAEARENNTVVGGTSIDQLLQNYITTMTTFDVDLFSVRRNLIVVLTKADKIESLPPNLQSYLVEDEIYQASLEHRDQDILHGVKLAEYIERMERVSNAIEKWIQSDPFARSLGGNRFVTKAENNNIHTRYCLISATGQDVVDENKQPLGVQIMPRRVLDPFFWALELQSH